MGIPNIASRIFRGAHTMLVGIMIGANLATILLMWATCLSTFLSPALHPRLSQAGLLFPIFVCIDAAFILAWLIVSWRWIWIPILGIAGCWNYARDYCPINLDKELTGENILVLSYNVAGLSSSSNEVFDGQKATEYIISKNADIICLQECPAAGTVYHSLAQKVDSLGYHIRNGVGLTIISRWPFIGNEVYKTDGGFGNGTLAWRINMDGDTILVINSHLQSNGISLEEKAVYNDALESHDKEKMKASGKLLFSRLTKAAVKREVQTDSVCEIIKRYPQYGIIATGDMNDTPISYTYQRISKLLKNSFRESGNGLGISFMGRGFPVRIDHIFVSDNWITDSTHVDRNIRASDHRPILTRLYKTQPPK